MKKITCLVVGLSLAASAQASEADFANKFYAGLNVGGSFATMAKKAKTYETVSGAKFSKSAFSGDVHFGTRMGAFGLELSAGMLNSVKHTYTPAATDLTGLIGTVDLKAKNYLFALDLGYYIPINSQQFRIRPSVGLAALYSKNTATLNGGATATADTSLVARQTAAVAAGTMSATDTVLGFGSADLLALTPTATKASNSKTKLAPKLGLSAQFVMHSNVSLVANAGFIYPVSHDTLKYIITTTVGVNYHF
jgi:hypothetical protein